VSSFLRVVPVSRPILSLPSSKGVPGLIAKSAPGFEERLGFRGPGRPRITAKGNVAGAGKKAGKGNRDPGKGGHPALREIERRTTWRPSRSV